MTEMGGREMSRRAWLGGVGCALTTGLWGKRAEATVAYSLSLEGLVRGASHVVIVTALSSESRFVELGRRRRIVTDTRVRVAEQVLAGRAPSSELLVRTLGGSVGDLAEVVHGQPRLSSDQACVAFLREGPDGLHYFQGMAQGHYPLNRGAERLLLQSPDLPTLLGYDTSAVKQLAGSPLRAARERILAVPRK